VTGGNWNSQNPFLEPLSHCGPSFPLVAPVALSMFTFTP